MNDFNTLDKLDLTEKRVVLRADFNVPIVDGKITSSSRIDRTISTIKDIIKSGGSIVIITHMGRPNGEKNPDFSCKILVDAVSKATGVNVKWLEDCIGDKIVEQVKSLKAGEIALCENLRFYKEETKNDTKFSEELSKLGDIFVNDAFSTSHRAHASTEGITKFLPSYAGRLMQAELDALSSALSTPEKPVCALIGGAKVSSKIDVLINLSKQVDVLMICGSMASTFLYSKGYNVGKTICEKSLVDTAKKIMKNAEESGCEIIFPKDFIVVEEFKAHAKHRIAPFDSIQDNEEIVDSGTQTIDLISKKLEECKTIVWNGPLGAFEFKPFDNATNEVAKKVGELTENGKIKSIAGGGDTVSAIQLSGAKDFTYYSTAGGAFLEWLEGKKLPAVEVLRK